MQFPGTIALLETHFVHWGFVSLSVPNLIVIATMIVMFVLAVLIPFPSHDERDPR